MQINTPLLGSKVKNIYIHTYKSLYTYTHTYACTYVLEKLCKCNSRKEKKDLCTNIFTTMLSVRVASCLLVHETAQVQLVNP